MQKVEVVPHDPRWKDAFEVESNRVADALGNTVVGIHHIGSTSIPGIYAKPIIDLLVEVNNITQVAARKSHMESLGYEVMGEFGIPGRQYFRKDNRDGIRTHHIHTFAMGSAQIERHLLFRDYMIAHPDEAQAYSDLKRMLAKQYPTNIESYMDGKDGFIKAIDQKAKQWQTNSGKLNGCIS